MLEKLQYKPVYIYDTTLRDGGQGKGVELTLERKLTALALLDNLGFDFIEGGWPGTNRVDTEFFQRAQDIPLTNALLCAFGSTRRVGIAVDEDPAVLQLLQTKNPICTIVGKSDISQVKTVLRTLPEENLAMISDTIGYLKECGKGVFYDAEHFFTGYENDKDYALETLICAIEAGADWLILCDTKGGTMTDEVKNICAEVKKHPRITKPLGIHAHNDCELAVANTMAAFSEGITQIQGTINGYGERTGNANLLTVIANLQLKKGIPILTPENLQRLTEIRRQFERLTTKPANLNLGYVGEEAFAHGAGLHADGVLKNPSTYEHCDPGLVGNERHFIISEQAGSSLIEEKIRELGILPNRFLCKQVLERVKDLSTRGFQFENYPASFELLVLRCLPEYKPPFTFPENLTPPLLSLNNHRGGQNAESGKKINLIFKGDIRSKFFSGVHKLKGYFPVLAEVSLESHSVQPINGTAKRAVIGFSKGKSHWSIVYVGNNEDIATWGALVQGFEYAILRSESDLISTKSAE